MNAVDKISASDRYARCVQASKRVRWDIDEDIIRGRSFDTAHKFLPDGLSLADAFTTLSAAEKRFVSQIQGRTYANIFGLVERFIKSAGTFERHRVVDARNLQIRVQFHGLASDLDRLGQLASPDADEDECRRQRRQQGLDLRGAVERVESPVETSERGIEQCAAHQRSSV